MRAQRTRTDPTAARQTSPSPGGAGDDVLWGDNLVLQPPAGSFDAAGMAAAGIVSLPGMMTGQILGGTPPVEAVK